MAEKTGKDYEVIGYELYKFPRSMTETGEYFGKTALREQAEAAVRNAEADGIQLFIKAVCSDGNRRFF